MTWGFSSYETRFRWAAAIWAILMTVWCMAPTPWAVRLAGAALWVAITLAVSARFAWWRPRLARDVPLFVLAPLKPALLGPLVRSLLASGYHFQTVSEALERPARKTVVLTFDGGTRDALSTLLPFLRGLSVKATCFVSDQGMRDAEHLKPLELQEMARSGLVEFGGTLPDPPADAEALRTAVLRERHWLTGVLGQLPAAFAYAPGPNAETFAQAARAAHYRLALTEGSRVAPIAQNPYAVPRRRLDPTLKPWQAYLFVTRGRHRL